MMDRILILLTMCRGTVQAARAPDEGATAFRAEPTDLSRFPWHFCEILLSFRGGAAAHLLILVRAAL